jgi:hypothetical protein
MLGMTILLAVSQAAVAQREEGRRGRGRFGGRGFLVQDFRLASLDEVQTALELDEEEKSKVGELNDKHWDELRGLLEDGQDREAMQKLNDKTSAALSEVLNDEQEKRLRGIVIQVNGVGVVLADPKLAKDLSVTDDQMEKLRDAQRSNMEAMGEAFREMRDMSDDERRAKFRALRAEADKKLMALLTKEQQEQLEALKGEKIEIDMSQLRGRGGRGRGERGDRDRSDREDSKDDSESKTS